MPTFRNPLSVPPSQAGGMKCDWRREQSHFIPSAYEDGTDRVFRNVGIYNSDAGELPKRKHDIILYVDGILVYIRLPNISYM